MNGFADPDGDTLAIDNLSVATSGAGELIGDSTQGWTFTPNTDWFGAVELTYEVTDGKEVIEATASFTVLEVNDAPTLSLIHI